MVNGIVVRDVLMVHGEDICPRLTGSRRRSRLHSTWCAQRPRVAHVAPRGGLTQLLRTRRVLQVAARAVAVGAALATGCNRERESDSGDERIYNKK